jgi:hypothetical protein
MSLTQVSQGYQNTTSSYTRVEISKVNQKGIKGEPEILFLANCMGELFRVNQCDYYIIIKGISYYYDMLIIFLNDSLEFNVVLESHGIKGRRNITSDPLLGFFYQIEYENSTKIISDYFHLILFSHI